MSTNSHRHGQHPSGGKRHRRYQGPSPLIVALCVVIAALFFVGVFCLVSHLGRTEEPTSVATQVDPVPENTYSTDSFTTESDGTVTYEDTRYYSLHGIDVSSHQGEIDWAAVADDDVAYAILRVGYRGYTVGALNPDSRFAENLAGATENNILVGCYFYSQAITVDEAREEAQYVLSILDGASLDLPIFYDWEKNTASDSRTMDFDYTILTECALAFCQTIEAGGYQAGIYFYSSLALYTYELGYLTDYVFWLSQPGEVPDFDYCFDFWQYSYTGTVSGISGNVDLDMMLVAVSSEEE